MATAAQLSMAEYLTKSYEPECEFVDGELVEKKMGNWDHSRVQIALGAMLMAYETQAPIAIATEWTMLVSETRARIPDLTLVKAGPQDKYLMHAPLLTVEILSPDDSWAETRRKCDEYAAMGVGTMWILDPGRRLAELWSEGEWRPTEVLTVAGTPVRIELASVWARL